LTRYRAQLGDDSVNVKPRGLLPSALYVVRSADGSAAMPAQPTSGATLMKDGINVTLPTASCDVIAFAAAAV